MMLPRVKTLDQVSIRQKLSASHWVSQDSHLMLNWFIQGGSITGSLSMLPHYPYPSSPAITPHRPLLQPFHWLASLSKMHRPPRIRPLPHHKLPHTPSLPIGIPSSLFPPSEPPRPLPRRLSASPSPILWPPVTSAMPGPSFDASHVMCRSGM